MKPSKFILKKNSALIWVVLLIVFAALIAANWTDLAQGFKDGYNSVPK